MLPLDYLEADSLERRVSLCEYTDANYLRVHRFLSLHICPQRPHTEEDAASASGLPGEYADRLLRAAPAQGLGRIYLASHRFPDCLKAMAPYMLSDNCACQIQVITTHYETFSTLPLHEKLVGDALRSIVRNLWTLLRSIIRRTPIK